MACLLTVRWLPGFDRRPASRAAWSVLRRSMATVIGPTPPGTGVIREATSATLGKSTSPQSEPSARLWMPTSMTTAPGLIQSARTCSGRPMAAIRMSACAGDRGRRLGSPVWQTVTVASPPCPFWSSSSAIGLPTICDRPSTTACAPRVSIPASISSSRIPSGVHGTNRGIPIASRPTLTGWKPSTSLSGSTRSITARSSICGGKGSWTRMPWTAGSALSRSMVASRSACVGLGGKPERRRRSCRRPCRRSACCGRRPGWRGRRPRARRSGRGRSPSPRGTRRPRSPAARESDRPGLFHQGSTRARHGPGRWRQFVGVAVVATCFQRHQVIHDGMIAEPWLPSPEHFVKVLTGRRAVPSHPAEPVAPLPVDQCHPWECTETCSGQAAAQLAASYGVVVHTDDTIAVHIGPSDHQRVADFLNRIANQYHVLGVDHRVVVHIARQHVQPTGEPGDELIADRERDAIGRIDRFVQDNRVARARAGNGDWPVVD